MDKELQNLLDNYENVIYGKAFPTNPSIHQLHLLLDYIANLEQQCKKQKEAIDRILNETKETRNILNNNRDDNILSKSCLLSYLEIVEDILKEVSE